MKQPVEAVSPLLAADVAAYSRLMRADEGPTPVVNVPARPSSVRRSVTPPRILITVSVLVVIGIASATWWAWRFISLELAAVYAEAFRKAGVPEE